MESIQRRKKAKKIDLKTIFGIVRSGNLELVKNFINENGQQVLNERDEDGFTPMHWAAFDGSFETFTYLMELSGEFDDNSNTDNSHPIHWAAEKGRLELVHLLLDHGVNMNCQDKNGFTPLINATKYGHTALVSFLVSRGVNLSIEDKSENNALDWAVYKGYPDLTRLLIIYGMNPKKINKLGQTLLHTACLSGNINIVQHLVEEDFIDTEIRDKNGRKAVEIAKIRGYFEVVDYLNRYDKLRRGSPFHLKTLLFGPVNNSRTVFLMIQALLVFYEYPVYFFIVLPETYSACFWQHILYFLTNSAMWFFLYRVHLTDPGYLKQNTSEYQDNLRRITFRSQSFTPEDWTRSLTRLCHTCKTIKPYRASHCRACNRCVLAYDHHCPYVQNCIGYNNRPYFFFFLFFMFSLQVISLWIIYLRFQITQDYLLIMVPGTFFIFFYAIMVGLLLGGAIFAAVSNLTGNETAKMNKYEYLKKEERGTVKTIFSKGIIYNIKYYFHLVQPSYLERADYDSLPNFSV